MFRRVLNNCSKTGGAETGEAKYQGEYAIICVKLLKSSLLRTSGYSNSLPRPWTWWQILSGFRKVKQVFTGEPALTHVDAKAYICRAA